MLYIRSHGQKQGFLSGCKPISGLDGCHLQGNDGGPLSSVPGRDGTYNLFKIALAVVEAKTKESWTWFSLELTEDIGAQGMAM